MDTADRVAMPIELLDLVDEVWGVRPSVLRTFASWVNELSIPASALAATDRPQDKPARSVGGGSTARLAVRGPISRRPTMLSFLCGGASTEEISAALREAIADPSVSQIVMEFDSPGGTVDGVPELAAEIRAAKEKKPVTAYVDTMAASAAYWLASQASKVVVAPSGQVGSIGVLALHMDHSRELDAAGVKATFIHAGKYKVEANPYEPLADDARAEIQRRVDTYYGMFVHDVAKGRGVSVDVVRSEFGEGRMVLAKEAVKRGMADEVGERAPSSAEFIRAENDQLMFAAARAAVAV